jgi:pyridinium-3,5-biscarboxylic acid mononucleotide sulfurtransferase
MKTESLDALLGPAQAKAEVALARLRSLGSALIAYSGGVDSALLLALSLEALGERAVAFTALSPAVAADELEGARALARRLGARHVERRSGELEDPRYAANPVNRCYFCKTELYTLAGAEAKALGLSAVVSGTNADELGDHRPGLLAAGEHAVVQPLAEAGLTKDEIRALSRQRGLGTWDKPQQPCLSSRIPYGTEVTPERLQQLARAEMALRALGLREFRVRYHGEIGRIEIADAEVARLLAVKAEAAQALREAGFKFVTLDLEAFRSGRLNEAAGLVPLGGRKASA